MQLKSLSLALALCVTAACSHGSKDVNLKTSATTWPSLAEPPPPASAPALYDAAVIVAIEDYQYVDDIPGAKANASDWARFLTTTQGVRPTNLFLLRDHEATKEQIEKAVDRALDGVNPGGKIWFLFIGHGAPNRNGDDAWLVGQDVQRNPDSIAARGLSQTALIEKLEGKDGVTPILVLDACFNGRTSSGTNVMGTGLQDLLFVDLKTGSRAVVLSASKKDEFAGPLPGLSRPAFSYLLLGAMRGWADDNKDGTVTAGEAVGYARDALAQLLVGLGRTQTPEVVGQSGVDQILAQSARENGPDLMEMRLRGAAGAEGLEIHADTLAVPDAEILGGGSVDFNRKADIRAEKLYEEALDIQKDPKALPEERASKWCELARMRDETNPYRIQALKMCREWQVYARALREKETAMVNDYEYIREYLLLKTKTQDQKIAACAAFLSGYGDLAEADYPHIRNVRRAERALRRKESAKIPSLSNVKIVPEGHATTTSSSDPTPPPGDRDGDGIADPDDACPDQWGTHDGHGCPG